MENIYRKRWEWGALLIKAWERIRRDAVLTSLQVRKSRTAEKKVRDPKEKIVFPLRAENKRLKELSMALVNMYYCTAKATSAGEEVPSCHNLHETVKTLIARTSSLAVPDSVQPADRRNAEHSITSQEDFERLDIEQPCSPATSDLVHLSMRNLDFSDICAKMTGYSDQTSPPQLMGAKAWSSQPDHDPTINRSHPPTVSHIEQLPESYDMTPSLSSLPLPASHAYLEPTFSRRLVRLLWEYAFKALADPSISPAHLKRCFGFCLRSRTQETLIRKFKAYLGLTRCTISERDRQVFNAAPDVRDSMECGSDEWGYCIEAGKIGTYLESLGFCLGENDEGGVCSIVKQTCHVEQRDESSPNPTSTTAAPQDQKATELLHCPCSL